MIEVDDVTVEFGTVTAVTGVSTTVSRGQFVGLVGPNGSGKTTLLRTIAGVLTPDHGTVTVNGRSIAARSRRSISRQIAVVPQDAAIRFDFSVREVVEMGRTPYVGRLGRSSRSDRAAVDRAMDRTAVADLADRSMTAVSGGERQRVVLARALAQETPVLLLDEPTASLDINHQLRTLELLRDLAADGKTVLAAIHDLNLAAHYCDELVMLGDGRLIAEGPPEAVLTEETLETVFGTRAIVSRHPVTGSTLVMAVPERPDREPRGRVHVIGGGGTAARLLYLLTAAGFEVSVGALNHGDADLETAQMLGIEAVTVDPFGPVTETAAGRIASLVDEADVTVLADVEIGDGNLRNLEAARRARDLVIVEDRPFEERNYAGETARTTYEALRAQGTIAAPETVMQHVSAAVAEGSAAKPSRDSIE